MQFAVKSEGSGLSPGVWAGIAVAAAAAVGATFWAVKWVRNLKREARRNTQTIHLQSLQDTYLGPSQGLSEVPASPIDAARRPLLVEAAAPPPQSPSLRPEAYRLPSLAPMPMPDRPPREPSPPPTGNRLEPVAVREMPTMELAAVEAGPSTAPAPAPPLPPLPPQPVSVRGPAPTPQLPRLRHEYRRIGPSSSTRTRPRIFAPQPPLSTSTTPDQFYARSRASSTRNGGAAIWAGSGAGTESATEALRGSGYGSGYGGSSSALSRWGTPRPGSRSITSTPPEYYGGHPRFPVPYPSTGAVTRQGSGSCNGSVSSGSATWAGAGSVGGGSNLSRGVSTWSGSINSTPADHYAGQPRFPVQPPPPGHEGSSGGSSGVGSGRDGSGSGGGSGSSGSGSGSGSPENSEGGSDDSGYGDGGLGTRVEFGSGGSDNTGGPSVQVYDGNLRLSYFEPAVRRASPEQDAGEQSAEAATDGGAATTASEPAVRHLERQTSPVREAAVAPQPPERVVLPCPPPRNGVPWEPRVSRIILPPRRAKRQ